MRNKFRRAANQRCVLSLKASFLDPVPEIGDPLFIRQLCRIFLVQVLGHFGKWILLCRRDTMHRLEEGNSARNIHLQRTALLRQLAASVERFLSYPTYGSSNCFFSIAFAICSARYDSDYRKKPISRKKQFSADIVEWHDSRILIRMQSSHSTAFVMQRIVTV